MRYFALLLCMALSTIALGQRKGYWQQDVQYKMDIDVDEENYQYDGKMTVVYGNNSGQSLSKVYFH